jgi:hypothetical protein
MKLLAPSLLFLVSLTASAQETEQRTNCPDKSKLVNICMMISGRTKDPKTTSLNPYMYHTRIMQAACVDENSDPESLIQSKVSGMWSRFENDMVCSSAIFDVPNGSYLKYAVQTKFDEFLDDAISWKVDLNKVDASDGRTVLDYVKFHMEKNPGSEISRKMTQYYDMLRAAGAKHKSEL